MIGSEVQNASTSKHMNEQTSPIFNCVRELTLDWFMHKLEAALTAYLRITSNL